LREIANHTGGRWQLIGVDVSQKRCDATLSLVPGATVICADVTATGIAQSSIDVVECSQVIEHLSDRRRLIEEIKRILVNGGIAHLSSVAKRPWAFFIRRKGGRFVLDHTHVIEYDSLEQFVAEVQGEGLTILDRRSYPLSYRVGDLTLRVLERSRIINETTARSAYRRSRMMRIFARLRLRIPGYSVVEVVVQRQ
jgi:SAM-dependent methyltransferase